MCIYVYVHIYIHIYIYIGDVKQEDLQSVGSEELLRRMGAKKVLK